MENISKMTIDDSSPSMYFSFNSTTAYKTMESVNDNSSMVIDDEDNCEQNVTLEADEPNQFVDQMQTVKKLSFGVSPAKAIPKNILKAYKALSSTPTKAQLLRSVEVNRGSAAVVDVCDLGLAFLEAPQESIKTVLSEDKENQPQESQEIVYSETSSEIVVSVIEKTQLEEKPVKKVNFSNLPVLKNSGNTNIRCTPKVRRSIARCEPNLVSNRPSRIVSNKRMSHIPKAPTQPTIEFTSDEIPKMLNSILKISKGQPSRKKSIGNSDNPFNLLGKATRMSIVKTTLNSPARKVSRKSVTAIQGARNPMRQSAFSINNRKSMAATSIAANTARMNIMPPNTRKSMLPTSIASPKKRIAPFNSRKSLIPPIASSLIPTSRKSMAPNPSTSNAEPLKKYKPIAIKPKPPSALKEDFTCEVCSRKFRVLSLFEAHKRSHVGVSSASTKQNSSSGSDKQCRYCDKKFAIAKALVNHLIQNCTKIPPAEKKKLLFPTGQPNAIQSQSKLQPKSLSNFSSSDSLSSNSTQVSRSLLNTKNSDSGVGITTMPPPASVSKLKKKLAHSGVYCTPKKQIPCHICKASFNNILAYTEHKLTHSNAASEDVKGATSTESTQTKVDVKSDDTQTGQNLEGNDVPSN